MKYKEFCAIVKYLQLRNGAYPSMGDFLEILHKLR